MNAETLQRRAYWAHIAWLRLRAETALATKMPAYERYHPLGKFVVKSRVNPRGQRTWYVHYPDGQAVSIHMQSDGCFKYLAAALEGQYLRYLNELWKTED